jgi:7-cyano-7-deazaguanine synthase in queuosine biosynthesis
MAQEAVLLNSGGIDSRVAAAVLHEQGWTLHSLYHDWTGTDEQRAASAATAEQYCTSHHVIAWPDPSWVVWVESLGKRALPHATFTTALLGAMYATKIGVLSVATGARRDSAFDGWRDAFQELLNSSRFFPDKLVVTPLWDLRDSEVTFIGRTGNVDLDSTWSCPEAPQCGACASCRRRLEQGIRS